MSAKGRIPSGWPVDTAGAGSMGVWRAARLPPVGITVQVAVSLSSLLAGVMLREPSSIFLSFV